MVHKLAHYFKSEAHMYVWIFNQHPITQYRLLNIPSEVFLDHDKMNTYIEDICERVIVEFTTDSAEYLIVKTSLENIRQIVIQQQMQLWRNLWKN